MTDLPSGFKLRRMSPPGIYKSTTILPVPGAPGAQGAPGGSDAATADWVENGPLTSAALSAGFVGKVAGLVADDTSAPTKAANAAILAAAFTPGSSAIIPPGTYHTDEVAVVGPLNIEGEDAATSILRNNTGSVLVVSGTHINVSKIYLRSGGGNHTIRQSGTVDQGHWDRVKLWQSADGFSIWDNAGHGMVDMRFTNFLSWHAETATVATWNLVGAGGTINSNVWEKFRAQFSGNYHFNVESTTVATHHSNVWRDSTWEVCTGGLVRLIGNRDYVIDNSTLYDLAFGLGTLQRDGIHADTNGSNALCIGTIRGHRRLDGSCEAGVQDIRLPGGVARGPGTILEHCQNITSGNPLLVDLNGNDCLVVDPGSSGSTLTTYTNSDSAQFINKNGFALPSTQAFKIGADSVAVGPVKVSQVLDFPSIPANSEATLTVTVTGALVTDVCAVSSSMLEAGLSVSSWGVTAADTVSIRLRNNTGSAIDPSARNFRVRVWR